VVAAAGFTARVSKLPPAAPVMVADNEPASTYTSSDGASTLVVPTDAPAAMVICAPFDSVTVTGVCAAEVSEAV
jgi:hypothetical protein